MHVEIDQWIGNMDKNSTNLEKISFNFIQQR